MMISSRGRYALRVMVDLAEHGGEAFIPLRDIADRLQISQKYLESIMALLSKEDLVEGVHGKGGGYRLKCKPAECTVGTVLRITEGGLSPVSCQGTASACERADICRTLPLWNGLSNVINQYLDSVFLSDLMQQTP